MPKLLPLIVPWKISPSMPQLGVIAKSFDGINHGTVTFMGVLVEGTSFEFANARYAQVAIALERIISVRLYPDYSSEDIARIESYDWSSIPTFRDSEVSSPIRRAQQFIIQWGSTGICPDPGAYVVEDSDWLKRLSYTPDTPQHLRAVHYLFLGSDFNVEAVAMSLKWEIVSHTLPVQKL